MGAAAEKIDSAQKKRRAKPKKTKDAPRRRKSDQHVDALRNEVLGIAISAASLAFLLALLSFYPDDVSDRGQAAMTGETRNLIGPVGAYVADIVLTVFGLASFLLPLNLAIPGLCFMVGKRVHVRTIDAIGYPVCALAFAIAAHLWLGQQSILGHPPGGWLGEHGAEILRSLFGTTGAYLLVYSVLLLTFVMTTGVSLVSLGQQASRAAFDYLRGFFDRAWSHLRTMPTRMLARRAKRADETDDITTQSSRPNADQHHTPKIKAPLRNESGSADEVNNGAGTPAPAAPKWAWWPFGRRSQSAAKSRAEKSGTYVLVGDADVDADAVLDLEEAGAEFIDPLDKGAVEGAQDTVAVPPLAEQASMDSDAEPTKPVVKRRKHKEVAEAQIEIPLPESLRCEAYRLPPLHLLNYDSSSQIDLDPLFLQNQAERLVQALSTFRIEGRVTEIHPGPVVTMYEFEPAPGVRISKISGLADDLAMALKAVKVRIVAPIPGKGVVGFEVPNEAREMVFLREIIASKAFQQKKLHLPMVLGKDIHGEAMVTDLARMPHLLVAGTTGSGKSVGVNCMITSLLYRMSPEDVRFIMVDPKMLELSIYEGIPHLLLPVVTDAKKASLALKWAVDEMERRYELMKNAGVRDLRGYNRKVEKALAEAEAEALRAQAEAIEARADADDGDVVDSVPSISVTTTEEQPAKVPYIVVVIDEFADLMMVAGKEVEYCVARIAQKARAAGIHLILATQRPSTDVITGVIKANFPTRIAFQVSSAIDSRTILSTNGAENLLGKGDMLFMPPGTSRLTRVHGAFVDENEIHEIVEFIAQQQEPEYLDESVLETCDETDEGDADAGDMDPMYEEAVRVVARDARASTSHLQRRLSLGYNRAARIVDQMERDGLVGPSRGAKPREVNRVVLNQLVARWDGIVDDGPLELGQAS
ncbi:MAG: DNA translocase FtsK 4TM domain-containing protein [Myxococcota bacterium]|nr:DNA translocase FtsK 4TM domain-containing protein [Myxococcota bacterium]